MCKYCIQYTPSLPPLGVWVPCFKMKSLKGSPFLNQLDIPDKMKIKTVKLHPDVSNCPSCKNIIKDLLSTKKENDKWIFYTPRTISSESKN